MSLKQMQDSLKISYEHSPVKSLKEMQNSGKISKIDEDDKVGGGALGNPSSHDKGGNETDMESGRTDSMASSETESIWSKLEKDKERKQKIRERLSSMQSLQFETSNNRDSNVPSSEFPKLPDPSKPVGGAHVQMHSIPLVAALRPPGGSSRTSDDKVSETKPLHQPPQPPQPQQPPHPSLNGEGLGSRPPPRMASINERVSNRRLGDDDWSIDLKTGTVPTGYGHYDPLDMNASKRSLSSRAAEDNLRIAAAFETTAGLRDREDDQGPRRRLNTNATDKWSKVEGIIRESDAKSFLSKNRKIASGRWKVPSLKNVILKLWKRVFEVIGRVFLVFKKPVLVDDFAQDSTFAVVTFTSRQAAVAARHCLADSRGTNRWVTVSEIPSPPLADAPVCNVSSFRGCVRPVTLTISEKQKLLRHQL
jgi:hypothetical protein